MHIRGILFFIEATHTHTTKAIFFFALFLYVCVRECAHGDAFYLSQAPTHKHTHSNTTKAIFFFALFLYVCVRVCGHYRGVLFFEDTHTHIHIRTTINAIFLYVSVCVSILIETFVYFVCVCVCVYMDAFYYNF